MSSSEPAAPQAPQASSNNQDPSEDTSTSTSTSASTSTSTTTIPNPAEHFSSIAKNYERMTSGATLVIARHLLDTTDPKITTESRVLDNACGTGIITREIMGRFSSSSTAAGTAGYPHVTAVDVSSSMTSILNHTVSSQPWRDSVKIHTEAAEALSFPDGVFTHSYTNFGLLFFEDAARAAENIFRTLREGGGVAYVTTWLDLGYYEAWECACREILGLGDGEESTRPGVSDKWKDAGVLEETMREAGFRDVRVYQQLSWRREKSLREMGESIVISVAWATRTWSVQQKDALPEVVMKYLKEDERFSVEEGTGDVLVKMIANVAVCKK